MKYILALAVVAIFCCAALGQPVDATGETLFERQFITDSRALPAPWQSPLAEEFVHVDPGAAPEGDYLGGLAFTPDGSKALVTNRMTDNVTVYDWATMQALANVSVGRYPSGIGTNSQYAVVACTFGNIVYIFDHSTYQLVDSIPAPEQPWAVKISPDGQYAFVACDIPDQVLVIDLATVDSVRTLSGFLFGLRTFSWNSANGRNDVGFTEFLVSPDGAHLISSDCDSNIVFTNTVTGAVDFQLHGILGCASLGLSGDNTTVVAVSPTQPITAYRISLASHTVIDSVVLPSYSLMFDGVAVNPDGSKAYVSISNNQSAMVRFATQDFVTFSQTYSAFWIGHTPDHQYAVSGQYNFALVSFETETVTSVSPGNSQYHGAVAPAHGRAIGHDPHRHEGIYFYDITNPSSIQYRGTTMAGETPEGDAPRFVSIARNRSKVVAANMLSHNVSVIDVPTQELASIHAAGIQPWEVAITSDSRWAVVAGFNSNTVIIVDLNLHTIATEIPAGSRPCTVTLSPDDAYAYVGNVQGNTISVIALDGENSAEVTEIPCGEIGLVWASYGVFSDIEVSPGGQWVLVAVSFDDVVKVIDTATNTVVADLPVGDFPLQIAFDGTDDYAVVSNYFSNNHTVLHIDGASSTVVGTFATGQGPLRVAYNPAGDYVGVGLLTDRIVKHVNPRTGAVVGQSNYTTTGGVLQVAYSPLGDEVVLTAGTGTLPSQLHRGEEVTDLPGTPACFALDSSGALAAVAIPGPDYVTLVEYEAVPHPPSPFNLLAPASNDTVQTDAAGHVLLEWEESTDPDSGDVVRYDVYVWLLGVGVDTHMVFAGVPEPGRMFALMDSAGVDDWQGLIRVQWWVEAISGTDTVESNQRWIFRLVPPLAVDDPAAALPARLGIHAAYPNPFNPELRIGFALPRTGRATLHVFDVTGRHVACLVDGLMAAGSHACTWHATGLPSGVYWLRLSASGVSDVRKVVLLK